MGKNPQELANQIIELVSELAELAGVKINIESPPKSAEKEKNEKKYKGATGGVRLLLKDGFFDEPKRLLDVITQLKMEGRHYPKPSLSMGLLSLVRERKLLRIPEKGKKTWTYVVRR